MTGSHAFERKMGRGVSAGSTTRIRGGGATAAVLIALAVSSPSGFADSAKLKWLDDGQLHVYQRFDKPTASWPAAKTACEGLTPAAHLATITSAAEQRFIDHTVLRGGAGGYFWLGADDGTLDGKFNWITGEDFRSLTNWSQWYEEPSRAGTGYASIYYEGDDDYNYTSSEWYELAGVAGNARGYVCERETDATIGATSVPDVNGNGTPDIAVLSVDYPSLKHTVRIKDGSTGTRIGSPLVYATGSVPPVGLAAVRDLSGNGSPEIAVLYLEGTQPRIWLKDAKTGGNVGDKLFALSKSYAPLSIGTVPDSDGNGADELQVSGVLKSSGKAYVETRDSKTGGKIGSLVPF